MRENSTNAKTSSEIWNQGLKESSRSKDFYSLLAEAKAAIEDGSFVVALAAFRQAACLARRDKALQTAAFDFAIRETKALVANNWRVASSLLAEAVELDPTRSIPAGIASGIEQSSRDETVANTLAEVKAGGDLEQVYERLQRAIRKYPGDSNLEGSVTAVSSAVIDKRGPEQRKRRLSYMAGLLENLQNATSVEQAEELLKLGTSALGPYRSDAGIAALFSDLKFQASAGAKASRDLADQHIASCLQSCSEVLHRASQPPFLVELCKKARQFVYPGEQQAFVQVQTLFDVGPLTEALETCRQTRVQFPESSRLAALEASITAKEATMRTLLEQGEASLLQRDLDAAGSAFSSALERLPLDAALRDHIATVLDSHAKTEIDHDWRAFDASLELRSRLLPDRPLPSDFAAVVQQRKEHSDAVRLQAEAVHKTAERGLQPNFLRDSPPASAQRVHVKLKSVQESSSNPTASSAGVASTQPVGVYPIPAAPVRIFDKTTIAVFAAVAATLIFGTLLALHDRQARSISPRIISVTALRVPTTVKPAYTYTKEDRASAGSQGNKAAPSQLATLEVRGAEPGTEVKVDNVLLGAAVPGSSLTRELSSGDHIVELLKDGFNSKRMALHFAPGEVALLTGSNVQLQSIDAGLFSVERRDWSRVNHESIAGIQDFLTKYPTSSYSLEANAEIQKLEWQNLDKNEPAALQAFLNLYPEHPYAPKARETLQALNRQSVLRSEQSDWLNLNKSSKPALSSFVSRYPNGAHAGTASALISELDSQSVAAANKRDETRPAETPVAVARMDIPSLSEKNLPAASSPLDPARADSAAVLEVIDRFANAWNAKDYRSIVAIEPDLNRRSLKAQLSPVKNVTMRISPVGPPQITGSQATVVCRRQADEIFVDGSLKQNPESIVTYVLAKRNGNWGIEATH